MLSNMNANTNVVVNTNTNTNANEEVVMNANTNANVVAMRNALNAMSLNYMWSIVDEEAYIGSDGSYDPQHYIAIINIIIDYTDYINEQLWVEQMDSYNCEGIFYDGTADEQQEFNEDFTRYAYSQNYSYIIFKRGEVVPF